MLALSSCRWRILGYDITPPLSSGLSPSRSSRKRLLDHVEILPCRRSCRQFGPFHQYLRHSRITFFDEAAIQYELRLCVMSGEISQSTNVRIDMSVIRNEWFQLGDMKHVVDLAVRGQSKLLSSTAHLLQYFKRVEEFVGQLGLLAAED